MTNDISILDQIEYSIFPDYLEILRSFYVIYFSKIIL